MKRNQWFRLFWGGLIPLVFAVLLGLTPRPAPLDKEMKAAHAALLSDEPRSASGHLRRVIEFLPWRVTLWEVTARSALAGGDYDTAIEFYEEAARMGILSPEGYLNLGDAHIAAGNREQAVDSWNTALEAGGNEAAVYTRLFEVHRTSRNHEAALASLQILLELDPDNAGMLYQFGLLLSAREPEAGLAYLLQAVEMDESLADAVWQFERNLKPNPETDDPAYTLLNAGRALAYLDEWALAAEAFREAIAYNPGYAEAWAFFGEAQYQLGLDSQEALQTAIELDPASLTANLLYGLFFMRHNNPEVALQYFEAAALAAPENPAVYAEIAGARAAQGDITAALANYRKAVELSPRSKTYLNLLAQYSILNDIQIEDVGIPAARAVVLMDQEDPIALDLIGYAYLQFNDLGTAERFLQRALNANPNYAPARLHFGLLYLALGQPEMAAVQLNLAIELAPGTPAAAEAARVLEQISP